MPWLTLAKWAGWPLAAMMFWAWLEVRDDLAASVERCNTRVGQSVAEAEKATRAATERAFEARLAQEALIHQQIVKALRTAQDAARDALSRPPEIREVIRREIDLDACLAAPVPAPIRDRL